MVEPVVPRLPGALYPWKLVGGGERPRRPLKAGADEPHRIAGINDTLEKGPARIARTSSAESSAVSGATKAKARLLHLSAPGGSERRVAAGAWVVAVSIRI